MHLQACAPVSTAPGCASGVAAEAWCFLPLCSQLQLTLSELWACHCRCSLTHIAASCPTCPQLTLARGSNLCSLPSWTHTETSLSPTPHLGVTCAHITVALCSASPCAAPPSRNRAASPSRWELRGSLAFLAPVHSPSPALLQVTASTGQQQQPLGAASPTCTGSPSLPSYDAHSSFCFKAADSCCASICMAYKFKACPWPCFVAGVGWHPCSASRPTAAM